ncbi:MAG: hypothetical protein Q4D30_01500 [Bacteroidales bacterium]|nr:hypothetical protein [Bacteroidales bacterium]
MSRDRFYHELAKTVVGMILTAVLLALCSCTRTVYVPQTSVQRDSIYITQYKRDSIYMHDSIFQFLKADTMYIERWHKEYIERKIHDTLYIERADTLRLPYPVEKPLTYWQKSYISIGKVSLGVWAGLLIAILVYFIIKRKL